MEIFNRKKYFALIIVLTLLLVGYFMMAGPKQEAMKFNTDIFSFRRITLAPVLILSCFGAMIYIVLKD